MSGALKVAMGAMVQSVDVRGSLVTNDFNNFGPTQRFPEGYYALPTNSGTTRGRSSRSCPRSG